jgi:hypothetical protein
LCIWAFGLVGRAFVGTIDAQRRFRWIVQLDHPVVINAVALSPVLRGGVRREWSDVPWADLKNVGHGWKVVQSLEGLKT